MYIHQSAGFFADHLALLSDPTWLSVLDTRCWLGARYYSTAMVFKCWVTPEAPPSPIWTYNSRPSSSSLHSHLLQTMPDNWRRIQSRRFIKCCQKCSGKMVWSPMQGFICWKLQRTAWRANFQTYLLVNCFAWLSPWFAKEGTKENCVSDHTCRWKGARRSRISEKVEDEEAGEHTVLINAIAEGGQQVWPLTQFYSVDFSLSRIDV